MNTSFDRCIYQEVKHLFPEGAVQTMVVKAAGPGSEPSEDDPTIRLVHLATGIQITCGEFRSQAQNYIAAAIRLRIVCDSQE